MSYVFFLGTSEFDKYVCEPSFNIYVCIHVFIINEVSASDRLRTTIGSN